MRFILGLFVIFVLTPQTPTYNRILLTFLDMSLFANYGETKKAMQFINWSGILLFLFLSLIAGGK